MSKYKITPMHMGNVFRPKSNMIIDYPGTEKENFPLISYLLEGEYKILIDTGAVDEDSEKGREIQPYTRTEDQKVDVALAAHGLKPEDIDIVILTHLHWDHASNLELFTNARMFVQKKEYDSLFIDNHPSTVKGYTREIRDYVKRFNFEFVDGDQKLFDGVSVVYTPGHTIGSQSVVVDTAEYGTVIFTGDLICLQESYKYDPPRGNKLVYNKDGLIMMYESIGKLMTISDKILPGHDMNVFTEGMGLI